MGVIDKYGNLSERELIDFLSEIQTDDEEIQDAQSEADRLIEETDELVEIPENAAIEEYFGDNSWRIYDFMKEKDQNGFYRRFPIPYSPEDKKRISENLKKARALRKPRIKQTKMEIQQWSKNRKTKRRTHAKVYITRKYDQHQNNFKGKS